MTPSVDTEDIQGLLKTGYGGLKFAAYTLLTIRAGRGADARARLRALAGDVTNAGQRDVKQAMNIAFTFQGLAELGLASGGLNGFSLAFREGMTSPRRTRLLGDAGSSAPHRWLWGGSPRATVHVLVLTYADSSAARTHQLNALRELCAGVFKVLQLLAHEQDADTPEHFGFLDGVGQPFVAELRSEEPRPARVLDTKHLKHRTVVPGNFILGYPDGLGVIKHSPSVPRANDPKSLLADLQDSHRRDFGRNGTYLVFRQLEQDVAAFRRYTEVAGASLWPGDTTGASRMRAKLVGRWQSGVPLSVEPEPPSNMTLDFTQALQRDGFLYTEVDPDGMRCPFGAHIRRANPRDGNDPDAAVETLRRTSFHRLMRVGRGYGPRLAEDATDDDRKRRGLHFICLNADIEQQFEFVQRRWLNDRTFAPFCDESDAILAGASQAGRFTIQQFPLSRRVGGLSSFVTVKGGAYFFVPGIRALRYLLDE